MTAAAAPEVGGGGAGPVHESEFACPAATVNIAMVSAMKSTAEARIAAS